MMSVGKGKTLAVTATATAAEAPPEEGADGGDGPGGPRQPPPPPPPLTQGEAVAETQSLTSSHVSVRGTAPRVSAAGALLLERLKVRQAHGRQRGTKKREPCADFVFFWHVCTVSASQDVCMNVCRILLGGRYFVVGAALCLGICNRYIHAM